MVSGGVIGVYTGRRLRPLLNALEGTLPYLRAMLVPVAGFTLGYALIAVAFAGLFASIHRLEPSGAFSGVPAEPSFWTFFYFSVMTMTSLGYSDLEATSQLTRFVASTEAVVGIAWMVAVFAAVIAYLQPRFAEISASKPLTRDDKMALARRWVEGLLNDGNAALADEVFTSDAEVFVNVRSGEESGPEDVKHFVASLRDAIPDLTVVVNTQEAGYSLSPRIKSGVRTSWTGYGHHHGQFEGTQPSGEKVTIGGDASFDIGPDGKASKAEFLLGMWSPQKPAE